MDSSPPPPRSSARGPSLGRRPPTISSSSAINGNGRRPPGGTDGGAAASDNGNGKDNNDRRGDVHPVISASSSPLSTALARRHAVVSSKNPSNVVSSSSNNNNNNSSSNNHTAGGAGEGKRRWTKGLLRFKRGSNTPVAAANHHSNTKLPNNHSSNNHSSNNDNTTADEADQYQYREDEHENDDTLEMATPPRRPQQPPKQQQQQQRTATAATKIKTKTNTAPTTTTTTTTTPPLKHHREEDISNDHSNDTTDDNSIGSDHHRHRHRHPRHPNHRRPLPPHRDYDDALARELKKAALQDEKEEEEKARQRSLWRNRRPYGGHDYYGYDHDNYGYGSPGGGIIGISPVTTYGRTRGGNRTAASTMREMEMPSPASKTPVASNTTFRSHDRHRGNDGNYDHAPKDTPSNTNAKITRMAVNTTTTTTTTASPKRLFSTNHNHNHKHTIHENSTQSTVSASVSSSSGSALSTSESGHVRVPVQGRAPQPNPSPSRTTPPSPRTNAFCTEDDVARALGQFDFVENEECSEWDGVDAFDGGSFGGDTNGTFGDGSWGGGSFGFGEHVRFFENGNGRKKGVGGRGEDPPEANRDDVERDDEDEMVILDGDGGTGRHSTLQGIREELPPTPRQKAVYRQFPRSPSSKSGWDADGRDKYTPYYDDNAHRDMAMGSIEDVVSLVSSHDDPSISMLSSLGTNEDVAANNEARRFHRPPSRRRRNGRRSSPTGRRGDYENVKSRWKDTGTSPRDLQNVRYPPRNDPPGTYADEMETEFVGAEHDGVETNQHLRDPSPPANALEEEEHHRRGREMPQHEGRPLRHGLPRMPQQPQPHVPSRTPSNPSPSNGSELHFAKPTRPNRLNHPPKLPTSDGSWKWSDDNDLFPDDKNKVAVEEEEDEEDSHLGDIEFVATHSKDGASLGMLTNDDDYAVPPLDEGSRRDDETATNTLDTVDLVAEVKRVWRHVQRYEKRRQMKETLAHEYSGRDHPRGENVGFSGKDVTAVEYGAFINTDEGRANHESIGNFMKQFGNMGGSNLTDESNPSNDQNAPSSRGRTTESPAKGPLDKHIRSTSARSRTTPASPGMGSECVMASHASTEKDVAFLTSGVESFFHSGQAKGSSPHLGSSTSSNPTDALRHPRIPLSHHQKYQTWLRGPSAPSSISNPYPMSKSKSTGSSHLSGKTIPISNTTIVSARRELFASKDNTMAGAAAINEDGNRRSIPPSQSQLRLDMAKKYLRQYSREHGREISSGSPTDENDGGRSSTQRVGNDSRDHHRSRGYEGNVPHTKTDYARRVA